jgi:hypothetical protein
LCCRLVEYAENVSEASEFLVERGGAILYVATVTFYLQEGNGIPEFDMARPYDAAECEHLKLLPFLSRALKIQT